MERGDVYQSRRSPVRRMARCCLTLALLLLNSVNSSSIDAKVPSCCQEIYFFRRHQLYARTLCCGESNRSAQTNICPVNEWFAATSNITQLETIVTEALLDDLAAGDDPVSASGESYFNEPAPRNGTIGPSGVSSFLAAGGDHDYAQPQSQSPSPTAMQRDPAQPRYCLGEVRVMLLGPEFLPQMLPYVVCNQLDAVCAAQEVCEGVIHTVPIQYRYVPDEEGAEVLWVDEVLHVPYWCVCARDEDEDSQSEDAEE